MKQIHFRRLPKRFVLPGMVALVALVALGALIPATAFAANSQQPKCGTSDVRCVITAGDALIGKRLTALNTLNSKISTDLGEHKITSDQAGALQSDVSTNQTGLNTLKTRLDAETVMRNARQDVASIFTQFRIFAVVLPRDYRHLEMDVEINAKNVMQGVVSTIKTAIGTASADKQTKLNTLYDDYQKQVMAAQAQIDIAQNDFPTLTPANFNQSRASFEATHQALDKALKAARADLHQAAKDLKQMANILGIKR